MGCPYCAVGMHRAVESAIGLPSRSTNASRILAFVTPRRGEGASRCLSIRVAGEQLAVEGDRVLGHMSSSAVVAPAATLAFSTNGAWHFRHRCQSIARVSTTNRRRKANSKTSMEPAQDGPGGQRDTIVTPVAAGSHRSAGSSYEALPDRPKGSLDPVDSDLLVASRSLLGSAGARACPRSSRQAQCSTIIASATRQMCMNVQAVGSGLRRCDVGEQRHRGGPVGRRAV